MADFSISGSFKRKGEKHNFNKVISGENKENAVDKLMATLGSLHGCPRRHITIDKVDEIDGKQQITRQE